MLWIMIHDDVDNHDDAWWCGDDDNDDDYDDDEMMMMMMMMMMRNDHSYINGKLSHSRNIAYLFKVQTMR